MKTDQIVGVQIQQCPGGSYNLTRYQTGIRVLQRYPSEKRIQELLDSDREFVRLVETSLRTEGPVEISDRHFNNWLSLYQDSLNGLTVPLYSPEGATSPAEVSFTMKQKLFQKQYGTKLQFFSKLENGEFNKYLKATSEKS